MNVSFELSSIHSIERVVDLVNENPEYASEIAGTYAHDGAVENTKQNCPSIDQVAHYSEPSIHLECLQDAGAEFDRSEALQVAKKLNAEYDWSEMFNADEQDEETHYMNLETGSVDTRDGWFYTNEDGESVNAVDLGEVVEVVKTNGEWVAV